MVVFSPINPASPFSNNLVFLCVSDVLLVNGSHQLQTVGVEVTGRPDRQVIHETHQNKVWKHTDAVPVLFSYLHSKLFRLEPFGTGMEAGFCALQKNHLCLSKIELLSRV